jgi:hypothetical protein
MAPNMNNTKNNTENMETYISTIRILLVQVKNKLKKDSFERRFTQAVFEENERNLFLIMKDLSTYICLMTSRTRRETMKNEPVYEKPPSFDQAVIDLVHQLCSDLKKFPELTEYFAQVNKTLWKDIVFKKGGSPSKKKGPKMRQVEEIETIVRRDMVVASSSCQSGKSCFMICAGIKGMVYNRVPVFVTRNVTGDADQLQKNCENYANILEAYLIKHGVTERKFTIETIRGDSLDKSTYRQKAIDAFNGKSLKMIICLGNATQLQRVLNLAKETSGTINLFIDEVDYVDYGDESETASVLNEIKEYAYQTIGITATPLAVMFNEDDLKAKNQLRLQPPSDYRGIVDILFNPFEKEATALNHKSTYREIIANDPNLEPFIKWFSKLKPVKAVSLNEFIPNVCLIKNSRFIANQECIFEEIVKRHKEMVVMVYNGSGVKMHVPGEKFEGYQKMNISDALQYLRDNGGVKKFKNIIIIAGDLAGRCISYVPKDYSWHLTDMYYLPAANTPVPEIIQSVGRLFGRNRGKGPLRLHAPLNVIDALFKGFNFTNEVIDRAIASPLIENGEEKSFAESLKSIPMNKDKVPPASRKLVTKANVKKSDFNLVKGKDGGLPMTKYQYKTEEVEEIIKNEKIEEVGESKYFLILEDHIKENTLQKKVYDAAESIIFEEGKIGKNLLRSWINEKILSLNRPEFKDIQNLNAHWLRINCQSIEINDIETNGLLFWKKNNKIFMRLNC